MATSLRAVAAAGGHQVRESERQVPLLLSHHDVDSH
jgi:hypothetical protein